MRLRSSETGELLLPILGVMILFGSFWVAYVLWCRQVYWKMRMDMAADATALSAAREEAALLNTIGTYQYMENLLMQKIKVGDTDFAVMQISVAGAFNFYNQGMTLLVRLYVPNVLRVAAR